MRKTSLSYTANLTLIIGLLVSAIGSACAQSRIPVFGAERLATQNWSESDTNFTPASPGHNATVVFPANTWSAFIGSLPINKLETLGASFTTHLHCRWITELATIKGANATVQFTDGDGHDVPGANVPVPVISGWQDITVTARVPKGATTVRYDIDCGAGAGTLEIADYDLYLDGVKLTDAADQGIVMPWLSVPGGKADTPDSGTNTAGADFTPTDPYSFEAPIWTTLHPYPIPTTASNKSPLNGVAANFQMAWTPEALFVRYHAHDSTLNFKAKSRYEKDCFEFFLMPTGSSGKSSAQVSKEQYTISRTPDGRTDANADAITRLVSDGWEAIVKIPLRTETRRIFPFHGLTMTFNAVYQDTDTIPQEHWLSFSRKDQTNESWRDTNLYAPLVFKTDQKVAYKPLWLGGTDLAYNVAPTFRGRINLVRSSASLANIDLWDKTPEAKIDAYAERSHNTFRIKYPSLPRQRRVVFTMSPFNVLAGETLDITMEARTDAGADLSAPGVAFLSESSWNVTGTTQTDPRGLTPQWNKLLYVLAVPETARGSLRNGRLIVTVGTFPGRTIELRDIKVTRRVPADFDALISVPAHYSHFWAGEKNTLDFQFACRTATQARITAQVQDYFTGKTLLSHTWRKETPAGASKTNWDVSALPSGFFNVLLRVRDANGGFLADRELYVSKSIKNTRLNPFSGIFVGSNHDVTAPASIPETVAALKGLGEGRAQWADFFLFDSEGRDLPGDPLALLKAYHDAGMETGYTVPQSGTHDIGRNWQPGELQSFYARLLTRTKGLFTHLSFSNEPNLYGGWFPEPDAREWAIYNRDFYNAVKKYAPGTRPILGSFNDIPMDFVKTAATENRNSFAEGVMGFHLYGLEVNGNGFTQILESRRALDRIHPGWEAWDTESGVVFYTFEAALDLQSKKMPMLLCAGYPSSIYLDGYGYTFPCSDSTPMVPMEAFKNHFYLDSKPVGRVTSPDGKVHIYLFRHSSGQGLAAFWNTGQETATVDLPVRGQGRLLDVFGNPLSSLKNGTNSLMLKDRFVRYARGVDLSLLMQDKSFIPAFQSAQAKPASDPGDTTRVFLSLPAASKAFDRETPTGQAFDIAISLQNTRPVAQKLKMASQTPEGLQVSFADGGLVLLKPRETRVVTATIKAAKSMDRQPFSLTGILDDGTRVLPLTFTIRTTPAIDVNGYTRAVEIASHSPTPAQVSVVATKPEFVFQPGVIKEALNPSASAVAPIQILPNSNFNGNFNILNAPVFYSMNVSSSQAAYTKDGLCTIFSPDTHDGGPADFANLPYTANPTQIGSEPFQVDYKLNWAAGGLRIIARVRDSSPLQTGLNGYLREGGDCMVIAFDPIDGSAPATLGANYKECGFAFSHQAPTSYVWDGHYGLESSTPIPEAINKINRDADHIYYDVTVPSKVFANQNGGVNCGMSIVFVNRAADGTSRTIELGQGILPQRDPARMGLLLSRK